MESKSPDAVAKGSARPARIYAVGALLVILLGILLLVILFLTGLRKKPGILVLLALVVLVAAALVYRSGGSAAVLETMTGLESGKFYSWKVVAEDDQGADAARR